MSGSGELKKLLTRLKLRHLAGATTFDRGVDYFSAGHVTSLVEHAGKLVATVQGMDEYRVTLWVEAGDLASDCSCPMGAEGGFCKHCVAVGLNWLAHGPDAARAKHKPSGTPVVTFDEARAWLARKEKSELVEIILDQATRDARLRNHLLQQAAKAEGKKQKGE